jgi:hypothetical protein
MSKYNLATITTSGGWTCYKWDSGNYMIFGTASLPATTTNVSQWGTSGLYRFYPQFTLPLAALGLPPNCLTNDTDILATYNYGSYTQTQSLVGTRIMNSAGTVEVQLMKASQSAEGASADIIIHGRAAN